MSVEDGYQKPEKSKELSSHLQRVKEAFIFWRKEMAEKMESENTVKNEKEALISKVKPFEKLIEKNLVVPSKNKEKFYLTKIAGANGFTAKDFMEAAEVDTFWIKKRGLFVKVDETNSSGKNRVLIYKGNEVRMEDPKLHEIRHTRKSLLENNIKFEVNGKTIGANKKIIKRSVSVDKDFNRIVPEMKELLFRIAKKLEQLGSLLILTSGYRGGVGKHARGEAFDFLVGTSEKAWDDPKKIREIVDYVDGLQNSLAEQGIHIKIRYEDVPGGRFWKGISEKTEFVSWATAPHFHVEINTKKTKEGVDFSHALARAEKGLGKENLEVAQNVVPKSIKKTLKINRFEKKNVSDVSNELERNEIELAASYGETDPKFRPPERFTQEDLNRVKRFIENQTGESFAQIPSISEAPNSEKINNKALIDDQKLELYAKLLIVDDLLALRDTLDALYPNGDWSSAKKRRPLLAKIFQGNEEKLNQLLGNKEYRGTASQNVALNQYIRERIKNGEFSILEDGIRLDKGNFSVFDDDEILFA